MINKMIFLTVDVNGIINRIAIKIASTIIASIQLRRGFPRIYPVFITLGVNVVINLELLFSSIFLAPFRKLRLLYNQFD